MAVPNETPYSIADKMLWALLEDETVPEVQDLVAWRKLRRQDGKMGTNIKAGEKQKVPATNKRPSLSFSYIDPTETPDLLQGYAATVRVHTITINGYLTIPPHLENEGNDLVRMYQYLVERAIGARLRFLTAPNSPYVPAGEENPITDVQPGEIVWPDFSVPEEEPMFLWPIYFLLDLGPLWKP